jgi:hypothetical protein
MTCLPGACRTLLSPTRSINSHKVSEATYIVEVRRTCFFTAAKSFGKFSDAFITEIHGEILSHVNQEAMGNLLQPSHGIVVQDTDVLQPEPIRQGGLVRKDVVRPPPRVALVLIANVLKATQIQTTRETSGTPNAAYIRVRIRPLGEGKEGGVSPGGWG